MAVVTIPELFGIQITKVFSGGDTANETLQSLCLDDEKCLKLFHWCLGGEDELSFEDFLKGVDGSQLSKFREDFWAEVVNFSDPLKKQILQELWKQYRKEVRKALATETSDSQSSDS